MPARYPLALLLALLLAPLTARAQAGALDPTFGEDGIALAWLGNSSGTGVAVDAEQNVLVSGWLRVLPQGVGSFLARYTPE